MPRSCLLDEADGSTSIKIRLAKHDGVVLDFFPPVNMRHYLLFLQLQILVGVSALTQFGQRRDVLRQIGDGLTASLLLVENDKIEEGVDTTKNEIGFDKYIDVDPSKIQLSRRSQVQIPRIGYSLYKTSAEQVADGVTLALDAGVRHFDVATAYGTTDIVGQALRQYYAKGPQQQQQQQQGGRGGGIVSISHKVANFEQSRSHRSVQNSVRQQLRLLPKQLIQERVVLVHSPLCKETRVSTYAALCELQSRGEIDAIGVAHFGVSALNELVVEYDLPAPDLIQLELSPFNAHADIAAWGKAHDSSLGCAAWSKLSSAEGPRDGWATLGQISAAHSCTKQQILIRWAVQKGYACVPRSSSQYKVERQAIRENSWSATQTIVLSEAEMKILDSLDEQIPAGRLGVLDGWTEADIVNAQWDPTNLL
jgi:diketogulonate reductase-like aldo/keto reductase